MNIFDILRKLGYDLIKYDYDKNIFTVIPCKELMKTMSDEYQYGKHIELFISEIGYNRLGNLYIVFSNTNEPNATFDMYEYRNMEKEYG